MSVRLKYDGLPEGTHTFTYDEDRSTVGPDGYYPIVGQPQIPDAKGNDIVEVEDLEDPKSMRAVICRRHVKEKTARVLEEKKKAVPSKS